MIIKDVLTEKGHAVRTVNPEQTVKEALETMNQERIGCLLVANPDRTPLGILSERDILRHVRQSGGVLASCTVREIMTPREKMIVATEADELDYAMRVMTENRIRHLPVVGEGKLLGVLSIGDLIKCQLSDTAHKNKMLRDYIAGRYPC